MLENRNKTLAKNTIFLGIGQFIPKLISLVTLPILTKYMSTDSYGVYDLILSVGSLAIPFFTLLIQQASFRFLIDPNRNKKETITNSFIVISSLFAIWFLIISCASILRLYSVPIMWTIFMLYTSEALYDSAGQMIRGLGKNFIYSIGVIIYSIINMLFLMVLLVLNSINAYTAIFISSLSYIIGFIYLCWKGKIFGYVSFDMYSKTYIKELLSYSLPIVPSSISLWIVNLSDRLLVIAFLGSSINGIYAAANKIPNLCGTAYSVFNLAWTENASRTAEDSDRNQYYSSLFNALFAFMVGAVMALMIISPLIFNVLIDEKFSSGMEQMPPLFLGILFSCMVSFLGGIYVGLKQTKQVGFSSAAGAVINLLINVLLIRKIGLFAASISTVISFVMIFVYRLFDLRKHITFEYDIKMMVSSAIGLTAITSLYYCNQTLMLIIGGGICLIYNWKYNFSLLLNIMKKLRR